MKPSFLKIIKITGCILPGIIAAAICAGGLLYNTPDNEALKREIIGDGSSADSEASETVSEETSTFVTSAQESTELSSEASRLLSETESSVTVSEKSAEKSVQQTSKSAKTSKPAVTSRQTAESGPAETSRPAAESRPAEISSPAAESRPAGTSSPTVTSRPAEISKPTEPSRYEPQPQQPEISIEEPPTPTGQYKDGTYSATAEIVDDSPDEWFVYTIRVTVRVSNGEISSVGADIIWDANGEESDNGNYVLAAVRQLSDKIINAQNTDGVDIVSGATYSSKGILKAVDEIISQARN